ncbi:MAG: hypothetical protein HFE63_04510 [Clostridiales bacterium]|nr:hypothetical protein [Clostridiales bacterium]
MKHTRLIIFLAALIVALLLCACDNDTEPAPSEISTIFRVEEVKLPDDFNMLSFTLKAKNGKAVIDGYSKLNPDAPWEEEKNLYAEIDSYTGEIIVNEYSASFDKDGWAILSYYYADSGEKYITKGIFSDNCYTKMVISCCNADGKEIKSYDCEKIFGLDLSKFKVDLLSGVGGFYIQAVCKSDGILYIVSNTGVVRIANDDTYSLVESRYEISSASLTDKGIIVFYSKNGTNTPAIVDFEAGKLNELRLNDADFKTMKVFALNGYDFGGALYNDGIYGFTITESGEIESTLLCDFLASDLSGFITSIVSVSPQCYYITMYDTYDNRVMLLQLTMIKPEDIVEKKHITVAMFGFIDQTVAHAVANFNRASEEYHLDIILYDDMVENSPVPDNEAIVKHLELDIVSGKAPDIFVAYTSYLDIGNIENYAEKGTFCDLYSLMEADGWDKNQLLDCITESFERKNVKSGKNELPYLPIRSDINVMFGSASEFPNKLTLESTLDKLESLDENQRLMRWLNFKTLIEYSLEEFIDYDTGKTNFDTSLFRRYCEMYRRDCAGEFWKNDIEVEGSDAFASMREGIDLLTQQKFTPLTYSRARAMSNIDDLTIIGYPDRDGSGFVLSPSYVYTVSESCEYKDIAFDFLKLLISEKYIKYISYDIPLITTDLLDAYIDNISRHHFIGDRARISRKEEPNEQELEELKQMLGDYVYVYSTDEEIAQFYDIISSARAEPPINTKILDIIFEELNAYVARDDVTIDDVIKYISSRVDIYYNEKMK